MPSHAAPSQLRAEFDAIARIAPRPAADSAEFRWMRESLPAARGRMLDIGCGTGDLARALAPQFDAVDGIDLSPGMIAEASRRSSGIGNVNFACADLFEWLAARPRTYDCILSIATLHHVDLGDAFAAMKDALRPGGCLLVIDLYDRRPLRYLPKNVAAAAVGFVREVRDLVAGRTSLALRAAYRKHGANETYLSMEEIRRHADEQIPGAVIEEWLLWRYTLRWEKQP